MGGSFFGVRCSLLARRLLCGRGLLRLVLGGLFLLRLLRLRLGVEPVHARVHTLPHPHEHSLGRLGDRVLDDLPLAGLEPTEDVVGRVPVLARRTDADPQPAVIARPEGLLDAPQALLRADRSPGPHPQLAERQGDVVTDDEDIPDIQLVEVRRRPDRPAAQVHERLGLHQEDLLGPLDRLRHLRFKLRPPAADAGGRGQVIDDGIADVVPCPVVFQPGVAQAHDQLHGVRPGGYSSSSAGFSFFFVMTSGSAATAPSAAGATGAASTTGTCCCFTCTTTRSGSSRIFTPGGRSSSLTWMAIPMSRLSILTRIDSGMATAEHSTWTECRGWSRTPPEFVPGATPRSSMSTVVRTRSSRDTRRKSTCRTSDPRWSCWTSWIRTVSDFPPTTRLRVRAWCRRAESSSSRATDTAAGVCLWP